MFRKTISLDTFAYRLLFAAIAAALAAISASPRVARAQIFVTNQDNVEGGESIGEYNLNGTTVNASLFSSGLGGPYGIAAFLPNLYVANNGGTIEACNTTSSGSTPLVGGLAGQPRGIVLNGSDLYITNNSAGTVGEYTTAGTTVSANILTGPALSTSVSSGITYGPNAMAISGSNLYITDSDNGTVYQLPTTGGTPTAIVTGLNVPQGIATNGTDLFVTCFNDSNKGIVSEYTTSGTIVNTSLITGFSGIDGGFGGAAGIALFGSSLYVVDNGAGTIGQYTLGASPGTIGTSDPTLVSGLNFGPWAIAVVPEPTSAALLAVASLTLLRRVRRSAGPVLH
jgi:hypothetical protein